MAGLNDTDIRLSEPWRLTAATTGDAPVLTGIECFMQDLKFEAVTQPGELFYDSAWGWGLSEFINAENDSLTQLEIIQRIKDKIGKRPEVDSTTIKVDLSFQKDLLLISVSFNFTESSIQQSLQIELNRVNLEVKLID